MTERASSLVAKALLWTSSFLRIPHGLLTTSFNDLAVVEEQAGTGSGVAAPKGAIQVGALLIPRQTAGGFGDGKSWACPNFHRRYLKT
jgi:hypothetical protein